VSSRSRRQFLRSCLGVAGLSLLAGCSRLVLSRQPVKVARVGVLSPSDEAGAALALAAMLDGLRDLGYERDVNLTLEPRFAGGDLDRLPILASELIELDVDANIALSAQAARALQGASHTVPIVAILPLVTDPLRERLVTGSLAHPGGNLTGIIGAVAELWGKRLELLKDVVPGASRIAVIWPPGPQVDLPVLFANAGALGVEMRLFGASGPSALDPAFEAAVAWGASALATTSTVNLTFDPTQLPDLALKHRLPAISDSQGFTEHGGLLSYATDFPALYRRAAALVDHILRGTNPGDIPVERPTTFAFTVNLKTAEALGLTIPPAVLSQATEVIQ
jgi:putative ABC transport system substrate-binding protein